MKIVRLQVQNFMGLRELDLKVGKVNVVNGKNRQGKTSVIRAIEAAFQGGDQKAKIRHGADSAEILIELDEMYVQRSIRLNGDAKLLVADKAGEQVKRPQEFLNSIVGGFSFNPAEFFLLDAKRQNAYLLESFPLKLTKQEIVEWLGAWPEGFPEEMLGGHALVVAQKLRKLYYDERTAVNREVEKKAAAGKEQARLVPADFDLESFDENGLKVLYGAVREAEMQNARLATVTQDIARLNNEVLELEKKLKMKRSELASKTAEKATMAFVDVGGFEAEIAKHEQNKQYADAAKKLIDLRAEYSAFAAQSKRLDKLVAWLTDELPAILMKRVKLPVDGMTLEDEAVLFNGKAFELLSGAEQVEVSLAIAKALNGKFGIVCVDGVEKLDDEVYRAFADMMEKDTTTQYFVTCVGSRGNGIVIEDGAVKHIAGGSNGKPVTA